jgi:hypothetical protein
LADALVHIALAGVTALAWLGAGSLLLRPLPQSGDRLLDALNRIGAGAAGWALATFLVGLAGLLYAWLFIPATALAAAAGAVEARRLLQGVRLPAVRAWPWWERLLVGLVSVYVVVDIVATCAPISSPDALAYHAAAPALFERVHQIRELPELWASYQPFSVEMLMLDGFLLHDLVQGAFAPLLLALASLAAVAGAAARIGGRTIAVLAATVYFAQPFMTWSATSAFVEPALAFAVALSAWNLWRFVRGAGVEAAFLAGLFAGFGAASKYVGVATACALAGAGVILARRRVDTRAVAAFAAPAILLALPWYVKNLVQTGDPLYPLLGGARTAEADESRRQVLEGYGAGRSVGAALRLPYDLLANGKAFDRGDFMSPLFLAFAPAAFLDRRARRPVAVVAAAALIYVGAWFASSQQARFLLPMMAPLAVLAGVGMRALADRGGLGRAAAVAVTAGALAVGVGVTAVYVRQFLPVVAGTHSADDFLAAKTSYYEGVRWLNEHLPRDALVLYGPASTLYLERDAIPWTPDALPGDATPADVRRFFREERPTFAVVVSTERRRVAQLRLVGARVIARVTVHQVLSRTESKIGPPETMLVFRVPR